VGDITIKSNLVETDFGDLTASGGEILKIGFLKGGAKRFQKYFWALETI